MVFLNKKSLIAIIFSALLMASALLTTIPIQAQEDQPHGAPGLAEYPIAPPQGVTPNVTLETIPYLSIRPNPVGLGQPFLVNIWLQPPLHVARQFTNSFEVTITKPDGTNETVGPLNSFQGDGTAWFEYVADQVGTWRIQFNFLGQFFPEGNYTSPAGGFLGAQVTYLGSAYYKPSSSPVRELVVQQEQVVSWPPSPLPTDYWTRPISMENREWWIIGGNNPYDGVGGGEGWPANTNAYRNNYDFTPYVQGPNSAHVVWRRQGSLSGIFGGAFGASSAFLYYGGGAFTFGGAGPGGSGNPNIIFQGRVYESFSQPALASVNGSIQNTATNVWRCYDLRTGDTYWELTGITMPPAGITYEANVPAVPGAVFRTGATAQLYAIGSSRLIKYNPFNGAVTTNISIPLSTGMVYADPYVLSVQNVGNNTNPNYRLINWSMVGSSTNFTSRIQSNISWPFNSIGTADFEAMIAVTTIGISSNGTGVSIGNRLIGVDLRNGQVLWNTTTDLTSGTQGSYSGSTAIADQGKFAMRLNDGLWHAWDLATGNVAWVSELTSYPWGTFGAYASASAYGLLFYNQYDGVCAYDWDTGDLVWRFSAPSIPYETPYEGQYSWFSGGIVADGKYYSYTVEHSPTAPIVRGLRIFCVNATSGKEIWNMTGAMAPGLVADGYLTASSYYDGYLYVFGKGKSATTVSASQSVAVQGGSVMLSGTVLDMSPGMPGTPCVSKESMTEWMDYLYMQKSVPANVTGVPVSLDAVDPNGNTLHIATVTTDISGSFSYLWVTPDVSGKYIVTATFLGDDSYGSSYAEAAIGLTQASASPTPTSDSPAAPAYTMLDIGIIAAVIIAIIIGILNLILLRRK